MREKPHHVASPWFVSAYQSPCSPFAPVADWSGKHHIDLAPLARTKVEKAMTVWVGIEVRLKLLLSERVWLEVRHRDLGEGEVVMDVGTESTGVGFAME